MTANGRVAGLGAEFIPSLLFVPSLLRAALPGGMGRGLSPAVGHKQFVRVFLITLRALSVLAAGGSVDDSENKLSTAPCRRGVPWALGTLGPKRVVSNLWGGGKNKALENSAAFAGKDNISMNLGLAG